MSNDALPNVEASPRGSPWAISPSTMNIFPRGAVSDLICCLDWQAPYRVSWKRGTPNLLNHPFWGTPIFGNPHIYPYHTKGRFQWIHPKNIFSKICPPEIDVSNQLSRLSLCFWYNFSIMPIMFYHVLDLFFITISIRGEPPMQDWRTIGMMN